MKKSKVSVVVLSYNKSNFTKSCIESILQKSNYSNIELIIVDNASDKETVEMLQAYKNNENIRLIYNKENFGFGKGNNIGMKASIGDYIILLNNDTIVTPGWIDRLIYHVNKKNVGLVGPVTNSIGNEAKIDITYDPNNIKELEQKAREYTKKHWGKTLEVNNIAAFCWIIKKSTYKKIGGFDERFGKAFFEDDDYCMRVKKAGYKILIAEDVFIHHFHSVTVNSIKRPQFNSLFVENKRKFEEKWGVEWKPHKYRSKFKSASDLRKAISSTHLHIEELQSDFSLRETVFFPLFTFAKAVKGIIKKKEDKTLDQSVQTNVLSREEYYEQIYLYREYLLRKKESLYYKVIKILKTVDNAFKAVPNLLYKQRVYKEITNIGNKPLIINLGVIDFNYRYQRPQHLAELMSDKYTVFYIESSFDYKKKGANIKKSGSVYISKLTIDERISLYESQPNKQSTEKIVAYLKKLINHVQARSVILKIDHPFWSFLPDNLPHPVIYDCMDDHSSFEISSDKLIENEKKLVKNSTIVLAASNNLFIKMKKMGANKIILLKNAGEYEHFAKATNNNLPIPPDIKKIKGRIIGYYGAIAEWFDANIIKVLAEKFPEDSIVLIGQISHPTLKQEMTKYNNVYLLGEKPYKDLPNYLQRFDVCLIPFVINDLIKATNPVKIYEYFAAGKPVVSTDLPELQEYKDVMYLSKSKNEFVESVGKALIEKGSDFIKVRQAISQNNTWRDRGKILLNLINSIDARTKKT